MWRKKMEYTRSNHHSIFQHHTTRTPDPQEEKAKEIAASAAAEKNPFAAVCATRYGSPYWEWSAQRYPTINHAARLFRVSPSKAPSGAAKLKLITKTKVVRMGDGLAALQEIASEMAGNLESMPSPAIKKYHLVYNTKRASNRFLAKLSSRKIAPDAGASESQLKAEESTLSKICEYLLSKPEIMEELEKRHGPGNKTVFADFAAAYHLQHNAREEESSGPKAALAAFGK